jgi:hypothetical protein
MKKPIKNIVATNPKVDAQLLRESMKISRILFKGKPGKRGRQYSLPSPFNTRLIRTSVLELVEAQRENKD